MRRTIDPATRAESLSTFAMVEFLSGRPAQDLMTEAVGLEGLAMKEGAEGGTTVFTASRTCHGLQLLWSGQLDAAPADAATPGSMAEPRSSRTRCRSATGSSEMG